MRPENPLNILGSRIFRVLEQGAEGYNPNTYLHTHGALKCMYSGIKQK